jgi:hypothetical protein
MTRGDMLQNMLAWANDASPSAVVAAAAAAVIQLYDDIIDNWAIVQIKPVLWNDDGSYVEGAAASSLNFPDPTGTDAFRSTPNSGSENAVVRTSGAGNEDGLNGNDFDFQHPFYGYHHYGPDGITGLPGDPSTLDDTLFVGGMCVDNPDLNGDTFPDWRLANSPDPGLFGTPPGSYPVSNYYFNDSTIADGATRASYGTGVAHLAFNGRDGIMSFEGIARWPGPDTVSKAC